MISYENTGLTSRSKYSKHHLKIPYRRDPTIFNKTLMIQLHEVTMSKAGNYRISLKDMCCEGSREIVLETDFVA